MQDRGIPGLQLAVIHDGQVVHLRGFGRADESGRAVTPQTPFRIGSLTKSFTALAIMQLVEQGQVELDAPVQRYVPWFQLADPQASAQITVAHLLYQTSGIPHDSEIASYLRPELSLDQSLRSLAGLQPNRPVGSSFEYANYNYNLLGLIVERVSGQPYATYLQQHIFQSLQMTHAYATEQEALRDGLAQGYIWWFGLPRPADDSFSQANLPAGYISSTAEDLSHYLIAQMNGGRYGAVSILSSEGITRMHTPGPNTQTPGVGGTVAGYGMGWGIATREGRRIVTHDGGTLAFHSRLLIDGKDGWGLVILTNADSQLGGSEPFRALAGGIFQRLTGVESPSFGPSLQTQYLVIDAVLLTLSALLLWNLVRLPHWSARLRQRLSRPGRLHPMPIIARIGLEILLPITVLLGAPRSLGLTWPSILLFFPDLGWWGLAAAGLLLVTGLTQTVLLARALHGLHQGGRAVPRRGLSIASTSRVG